MPDQKANTVADFLLKEVICSFGVPLLIHSDRGSNLILFCKVCQSLGMKTQTIAYHPQSKSDGIVKEIRHYHLIYCMQHGKLSSNASHCQIRAPHCFLMASLAIGHIS